MSSRTQKQGLDWITLSLYLSLVILGWLLVYATNYTEGHELFPIEWKTEAGKQLMWVGISLVAFVIFSFIDWKTWDALAFPIYISTITLLIAVLIFGTEIKGAKSWFTLGGVSFQPSELAKLGTAIGLAHYVASFKCNLKTIRSAIICGGIITVPALLILMQPDAGSALVFSSFFILLYRRGLSSIYYMIGFSLIACFIIGYKFGLPSVLALMLLISLFIQFFQMDKKQYWLLAFVPLVVSVIISFDAGYLWITLGALGVLNVVFLIIMWSLKKPQLATLLTASLILLSGFSFVTNYTVTNILKPHQRDRVNVWLKPEQCDPQGSLYNLMQSKLAISAGGVQGKGYLNGTMTRLNYVPEQSTDFIFSTVGEEHGFIGVLTVIILFLALVWRITIIAERSRHAFITNYAYALAGIIFVHFFLNIGMTMGVTPVIGIPLPFLSKGGSSLLIFSIMMGLLLRMDLARLRR